MTEKSDDEAYAVREIEKLERKLAQGKARYVIVYTIVYLCVCAVAFSFWLITLGKPPPSEILGLALICALVPVASVVVSLSKWARIAKRLEELRAGRFIRPPSEIRDAELLMTVAAIFVISCVVLARLPDEFAHPLVAATAPAGCVFSLWGVYKSHRYLLPGAKTTRYRVNAVFCIFYAMVVNTVACIVVFDWGFWSRLQV